MFPRHVVTRRHKGSEESLSVFRGIVSIRHGVKTFVCVSRSSSFSLLPRDGDLQPHSVIVPPVGVISKTVLRFSTCGRFGSDTLLSSDGPLPQQEFHMCMPRCAG